MQFYTVKDESNIKHKILVIPLSQKEMTQLSGQCEKCMPSISISSLVQVGHPYVIVDFGGWKTAIALDERSEDGHRIGDELAVGDVLNVILTSEEKALKATKQKVFMNIPLEAVIAFSFLYNSEMVENYALFKMVSKPKAE